MYLQNTSPVTKAHSPGVARSFAMCQVHTGGVKLVMGDCEIIGFPLSSETIPTLASRPLSGLLRREKEREEFLGSFE
jgi:hypothetical protein